MSRKTASPPADATGGKSGPPKGRPGKATRGPQPLPTPHRPVVSLALVLFVPALWLVLHGNLSVQTALFRFIGALMVSWFAAWVVLTTVSSYARSATQPARAAGAGSSPGASGQVDLSAGSPGSTGSTGVGRADVAGRPSQSS